MANESDFLIRLITDASKAKTDVDYVRKQLITLQDTATQVGSKLGDIERLAKIDNLAFEMGTLAKTTGDVDAQVVKLVERLHQLGASSSEIDRAASAFSNAQSAAGGGFGGDNEGGGGGGGTSKLTQFGSKLRGLPSVQIPGTGVGTDAIANMIRVLGALPPVLLPVIAGFAALGAGAVVLNQHVTDATGSLREVTSRTKDYYDLLVSGSTESINAKIKEITADRNAAQKQVDDLSFVAKGYDELHQKLGLLSGPIDAVTEAAGALGATNFKDIREARIKYDEANAELKKQNTLLDQYSGLLGTTEAKTNDAAEAEKKLADARQKTNDQLADDTVARAKRDADLKRTGSADQIQAQIDDLLVENDAMNQVLADVKNGMRTLSEDELTKLNTAISKNTTDIGDLTNNILKFGEANDTAKQNLKDEKVALDTVDKAKQDAITDDKKRADDIQAINDKTAAAYVKLAAAYKVAGDAAIEAAKQADAKTGRTRADEDVKTALDRQAKIASVDEDAAQKEIDRKIKLNQTLKKIDEEFNFSSANAIQNRDAVALNAAETKRDKDKSDAEQSSKNEQTQNEKDREKRLKALQIEFALQDKETKLNRAAQDRETAIARANDTRARREKYFRDQNDLQAAQRADLLARNNAYIKQISDLKAYLTERITTDKGYFGTILAAATKFQSDLSNILNGGSSGTPSGGGGSSSPQSNPATPAGGHYVPTADLDFLPSRSSAGSAFNPVFNIVGQGKAVIKQQVNDHLDTILSEMGA